MNINLQEALKKEIGQKRIKPLRLENIECGYAEFTEIAQEMLSAKGKNFDPEQVKIIAEQMIDWLYMLGIHKNDYHKGILVKGRTGRGKTFLFRTLRLFAMIDNFDSFTIVNVKQISGEYQDSVNGGYQVLERYGSMRNLVLDDIGKEQDYSASFGNKVNVVEEIIDIRERKGLITHGTTNLEKMSGKYDDRTTSRMSALFNVLTISHKTDYRL